MLSQQTLTKLTALGLKGLAKSYAQQLLSPKTCDLTFDERFGLLIDEESAERENRHLQRRLRTAKLKQTACVENIDFHTPRGLDKMQCLELAQCHWVKQAQHLIITGPTGVGKSYLACALAHAACTKGFNTRYYRLSQLLDTLAIAHLEHGRARLMALLAKVNLLVIDDWGFQPLNVTQRFDLFDIIDDRCGVHATLITSQKPIPSWYEDLQVDPTLADALIDRLLSKSIQLQLTGNSWRKKGGDTTPPQHHQP